MEDVEMQNWIVRRPGGRGLVPTILVKRETFSFPGTPRLNLREEQASSTHRAFFWRYVLLACATSRAFPRSEYGDSEILHFLRHKENADVDHAKNV